MTASDNALILEQQLCFALYNASRALIRAYGPLLEPLGLTYPQYLVMLVLWEVKSATVKALGERLALDSGTLTPLLKRLEQRGLIMRKRDPEDERVVRITLTVEGLNLKEQARSVPTDLICRTGGDPNDSASLEQVALLRQALQLLTAQIQQQASKASKV